MNAENIAETEMDTVSDVQLLMTDIHIENLLQAEPVLNDDKIESENQESLMECDFDDSSFSLGTVNVVDCPSSVSFSQEDSSAKSKSPFDVSACTESSNNICSTLLLKIEKISSIRIFYITDLNYIT